MINKKKIFFTIKIIIFVASLIIVLKELQNPDYKIIDYLALANISTFCFAFFLILISNFLQIYANKIATVSLVKKKLTFVFFSKLFLTSQILNICIPHVGIFYKAFILKTLKLNYSSYFALLIYLFLIAIFTSFFLFSIEIYLFGSILKENKNIIFLCTLLISFFVYIIFQYGNLSINVFKKKNKRLFLKILNLLFLYKKFSKLNKNFRSIIFLSFAIHCINLIIFVLIIKSLKIEYINLDKIIIFFVISALLDLIPITPKNLGIGEMVFGYSSIGFGYSFEFGVALKVLHRFLYFLYLFSSFVFINFFYYKNSLDKLLK